MNGDCIKTSDEQRLIRALVESQAKIKQQTLRGSVMRHFKSTWNGMILFLQDDYDDDDVIYENLLLRNNRGVV